MRWSNLNVKKIWRFSFALLTTATLAACGQGGSKGMAHSPVVGNGVMYSNVSGGGVDLTGYHLTFDENFQNLSISDANANDGSTWYTQTKICCGVGTSGINSSNNPFSLAPGGGLDIAAKRLPNGDFTTGIISSVGPDGKGFSQQYGYFEMKAKFPLAEGAWPAFWMLATEHLTQNRADSEIDIVEAYEHVGVPGDCGTTWRYNYHETLHDYTRASDTVFESNTCLKDFPQVANPDTTDGFHTYGMKWTQDTMTFYYDGVVVSQAHQPAVMNQPSYLIVNLGLGNGDFPNGTPDRMDMIVQYIRVYAQDGTTSPDPNAASGDYANPFAPATPFTNLNSNLNVPITMMPVSSGLKLRVPGSSAGTVFIQDRDDGAADEEFLLQDAGSGHYSIRSVASGMCMTIAGASSDNGVQTEIQPCANLINQAFVLTQQSDNSFELKSAMSSRCPGISGASTSSGATLIQWDCNGTSNNHFLLRVASGGRGNSPMPTPVATPMPTPVPTPVATPMPTPVATPMPTPVPVPVSGNWVHCAVENGICAFSGTAQVRYGYGDRIVIKNFSNGVRCSNDIFGDPAFGYIKSCDYLQDGSSAPTATPPPVATPTPAPVATPMPVATPTPAPISGNWVHCAVENGICSFSGTAQVRYGYGDRIVIKSFTDGVKCSNDIFGDPAFGYIKSCDYLQSSSGSSTPPSNSGSTPSRVISTFNGLCAHMSGDSTSAGAQLVQTACSSSAASQAFVFSSNSDGSVRISSSLAQGLCLEEGASSVIEQRPCSSGAAQNWLVQSINGGAYLNIKNVSTGRCMNVAGNSTAENGVWIGYSCDGGFNERFLIK
jgi:beta-glucanase (GH16 family)